MSLPARYRLSTTLALAAALALAAPAKRPKKAAAPAPQKLDEAYTAKIREYTTEPFFLTELVDHLPASERVPSPDKLLGYAIGTPDKLTYSKDIYAYFRELEKASPRVRVFPMGRTEEGREMIVAAVSDDANIAKLDRCQEITARLADPRKITDAEAKQLVAEGVPMYWLTGSIHSSETGSPEMLMELAYRLAVEESPFVEQIRKNSIVMITPLVEVDGHDRYVDIYRYRKAHPDRNPPSLVYWGKYVGHDNNRDGMSLALALSRNIVRTFLEWHPQVLHDLHESIPFLYTSTGTGPYNAWLDPIVFDEQQALAWYEVGEMTRRGVPGIWTHGFYDGWAANYMFYAALGHNAIGRFYETFGGRDADTAEREVPAGFTTRQWYRPSPPLAKVKWSIRNNINLQQSALLLALNKFACERRTFLENFWLKSKRSVAKATTEGPAAWVIPGDDPRPAECAGLVKLLQLHGIEVHRLAGAAELELKPSGKQKFPAGSYVVRMDQPYSRMADLLLDTQYYNPKDPAPYDDTGWSLGALRNIKTVRVTDAAILEAEMSLLDGAPKLEGAIRGDQNAAAYLVNHTTENTLATFRFRLRDISMLAAEASFKAADREFAAGSFIIPAKDNPADLRGRIAKAGADLGVVAYGVTEAPRVAVHTLAAPRIALVHTWTSTQNEGWVRLGFDSLDIPYDYISDQVIARTPDLRSKYDVILFGPTPGQAQRLVMGNPMRIDGPIPYRGSAEMPNIGTSPDQTDDLRGGMGLEGVLNLKRFIEAGGLFITIAGNASIAIDFGLTEGVSIAPTRELKARGSVFNATFDDRGSPIAYGYGEKLAVYFNQAPVLQVSTRGGFRSGGFGEAPADRPSGRGSASDPDVVQARPFTPAPPKPELKPGEEPPLPGDLPDYYKRLLPKPEEQPRIVLRFGEEKDLLVSGMLAGGRELANRPAVVDVPAGKGHVVLFANNPMWRQQTQGSWFLLFNAMFNFDHLGVGRKTAAQASD